MTKPTARPIPSIIPQMENPQAKIVAGNPKQSLLLYTYSSYNNNLQHIFIELIKIIPVAEVVVRIVSDAPTAAKINRKNM